MILFVSVRTHLLGTSSQPIQKGSTCERAQFCNRFGRTCKVSYKIQASDNQIKMIR